MKNILISIAAAFLICSAASGQTAVENLIARIPSEAELILIVPNLPSTLKELQIWTEIALTNMPEEPAQITRNVLESIQECASGPVIVGIKIMPPSFVGFAALADAAKTEEILLQFGERQGEFIVLGDDNIFCSIRDGVLVFSESREAVSGDVPGGFALDNGMQWLMKSAGEGTDVLILKKAGSITAIEEALSVHDARPPFDAIRQRISAMLRLPEISQSPALLALDFMQDGLFLVLTRLTRNPLPEEAALAAERSFPMADRFREWPIRLLVSGGGPQNIFDAVRAAESRFDPDVGAEFDEEMAELNRDLGFDFRGDFLTAFGGNWAAVLRYDETPQMAVWCEILDMQAVLKGARGLAELGKMSWQETQRGGGAVVQTGSENRPLVMLASPDAIALARSGQIAQLVLRNDPLPPSKGQRLCLECTAHLSELGRLLADWPKTAMIGDFWAELPPEAKVRLNYHELPFAQTGMLTLSGITPESIGTFLGPVVGGVHEAREAAQKAACMSNLAQILKACITWQVAHKEAWPPSLDALVPHYVATEKVFICPSLGESPSYRFLGNAPTKQMGPGCPVIYDLAGNHADGRNVGFFDGHAQWMNEEAIQQMLREQYAELKDSIEAAQKKGEPVEVDMPALEAFFEDREP